MPVSGPRGTHGSPLSMVPTSPGCRGSLYLGSKFQGPGGLPYRDLGCAPSQAVPVPVLMFSPGSLAVPGSRRVPACPGTDSQPPQGPKPLLHRGSVSIAGPCRGSGHPPSLGQPAAPTAQLPRVGHLGFCNESECSVHLSLLRCAKPAAAETILPEGLPPKMLCSV